MLCRIQPLRDFSLLDARVEKCTLNTSASQQDHKLLLSVRFSELIRKIWNPKNFKGHVAPHEFMEAVSLASNMRFKRDDRPQSDKTKALDGGFGGQADPIQFLAWLLNNLKSHQKVITENFQGQLKVKTTTHRLSPPTKTTTTEQTMPFYFLSMELPNVPLFKEQNELSSLP